jgi:hypothetical protein
MTPSAASASDPVTCATPGCGAVVARRDTTYNEGLGQLCRDCDPTRPWEAEAIDLPF